MGRITPDILEQMKYMRERGATYSEIQEVLGVSKDRCMVYLKGIPQKLDAMSFDWQIAETEAAGVLKTMGFSNILNLNSICNVPPYWDYYADKEGKRWLIDVTVNGQKSIMAKHDRCVEGFSHAILLKDVAQWKLIEMEMEVKQILSLSEKENIRDDEVPHSPSERLLA